MHLLKPLLMNRKRNPVHPVEPHFDITRDAERRSESVIFFVWGGLLWHGYGTPKANVMQRSFTLDYYPP